MIYSDSLECMVHKGFTYKGKHYTWNDADCVYYWDEADDDYFMKIPDRALVDGVPR